MFTSADYRFMDAALALARAQLGRTAPNPAVGCIIVSDGSIVGWGATADGGRPHAERQALDRAGELARSGRAYVTLEPCAFQGQTPPCADALVTAGVGTVLIGCLDEHPKVAGRGMARLRDAGISVETGLRESEAARLYAGFFHRLRTGQPLVYLDASGHARARSGTGSPRPGRDEPGLRDTGQCARGLPDRGRFGADPCHRSSYRPLTLLD